MPRLDDDRRAISDIFGGNAFLPVPFLSATMISGSAALPKAQDTAVYHVGPGGLLACACVAELFFRPKRRMPRMGIDASAVLILYAVDAAGLFAIALALVHDHERSAWKRTSRH